MRKSMVCAMSVIMAAGTFQVAAAAANPFSDVPQDHWAYDAVAQLAKDGVIDGYGDGRYQGERNITRYEMAQMVAKAMAKTNVSSTDKSMIDKLSAEFADELNNLGVRVAKLERNADQVKFTGEARYTYNSVRHTYKDRANSNNFLLRLEPTAEVNDHWQVKARIDSTVDMKSSETTENAKLKRIWAQGNYSNFTVKLGKIPCFSQPSQGMIMDTELSGGQVTFGNVLKTTLTAGRYNQDQPNLKTTGNYRSAELLYDAGGRFTAGAAYYYIGNSSLYHYFTTVNADAAKIWQAWGGGSAQSCLLTPTIRATRRGIRLPNCAGPGVSSWTIRKRYLPRRARLVRLQPIAAWETLLSLRRLMMELHLVKRAGTWECSMCQWKISC